MCAALKFENIDPSVEKLFQLFGAIDGSGGLRQVWLENPMGELRQSIYNNHDILLDLLSELFESTDGQLQGIPGPNPGDTWYPIPGLDTNVLFITTREATIGGDQHLFFGLGLNWNKSENGLDFKVFAKLPLMDVNTGKGKLDFALGQENSPVQLAFSLSHKDGFGDEDISFDGIKLAAQIYLSKEPELSFQIQQLNLPGEDPQNINLAQLGGVDPQQWFHLILSFLTAKLQDAGPDVKRIVDHVFPILGLKGTGPLIKWWKLPSQGIDVLKQWLQSLVQSESALNDWLQHWYDVLNGPAGVDVQGSGTRLDPKRIKISLDPSVDLFLTVGHSQTNQGHYQFYPGLVLASAEQSIGTSDVKVNFQSQLELAAIQLSAGGVFDPLPSFNLCARLYKDADDLVDVNFAGAGGQFDFLGRFRVLELRAGIEMGALGQLAPQLEMVNVRSGQGNWPVIDMTSGQEFIEGLADIANSVISDQIQTLLGAATASNHPGKHLAALLGIIAPTAAGTPNPWPLDLVIDAQELVTFLGNPLSAIACYHGKCIEQEHNGAPLWNFLVSDLVGLLRHASIPVPTITGTGDENDPWKVEIYSGAEGHAYLCVSAEVDGINNRPQLDASLLLEPALVNLSDDADLRLQAGVNLMHLDIPPSAQCPGAVNAKWLESVSTTFRLIGKPKLEATTGIGLAFSLKWIELGCVWRQQNQFSWLVGLEDFKANWMLDAGQSFALPRLNFGGGFDLSWNFPTLDIDLGIDLPDFSILLKLCFGSWLVERGGSFGFGLAGLLGLFPNINFKWPDLPDFPGINLPDWNTGPFSFPIDWPSFDVPDWGAFFGNPWPFIWKHIKLLFSKPSWAFPSLRFLGGSIFGRFPDFSLPDWGWGSGDGFQIPDMGSLPFSITGDGAYGIPWALKLDFDEIPPVEFLVWLDPDGPPTGDWAGVMISLLPESWRNINTLLADDTFGLSELGQLLEKLEDLSPLVRRMLSGVGGDRFGHHLVALYERLRLSDGLVPYVSQLPAAGLTNWESAFALDALPEENHFAQLSNSSIVDQIEAKINAYSGADNLPVLCLGAAWESLSAWQTVFGRFANPAIVHFDMRQIGVDPDQIGLSEIVIGSERFFIGEISVFNTAASLSPAARLLPVEGASSPENSQAKQVTRMVERICVQTGKKVILVAHSHTGLAALAAVQRENALVGAQKKIAGLITVGTPLINTPLVWAPEEVLITGAGDSAAGLPADLDIKKALEEALAFLNRLGIDALPGSDKLKNALKNVFSSLGNDLDLPAVVNGAFPEHAFDGIDDLTVGVPACAIASKLPDFNLKQMVLNWLQGHLNDLTADAPGYTAPTHVGFGVRYSDVFSLDDLQMDQCVRFDICRVALTDDAADESNLVPLPRIRFDTDLKRTNGWLLGDLGSNPRLRQARLGLSMDPVRVVPEVILHDAYLDGVALVKAELKDVLAQVPGGAFDLQATMQRLLDDLIQALGSSSLNFEQFRNLCQLLAHFDLVTKTGDQYGFKLDGWQSLLNDAENYMLNRLRQIAADSSRRASLLQTLADDFDVDLRNFPGNLLSGFDALTDNQTRPLKELLAALDLLLASGSNYDIDLGAWVDLLTNPADYLKDVLANFLGDTVKTTQLKLNIRNRLGLDDITRPSVSIDYSPLHNVLYQSNGIYELCFDLPSSKLGGQVALSGCVKIDLTAQQLSVRIKAGPAAINLKLVFDLTFSLNAVPELVADHKLLVQFGDADLSFGYDDLQLYPAPGNLAGRLGQLLPRFALNTALATLMEQLVIKPNQAWGEMLVALGIAQQSQANARILMRPIDGLINDPKTWFLSKLVVGAAGSGPLIDSAKITHIIDKLAEAFDLTDASGTIRLPYGLQLACVQNAGVRFAFSTGTPLALSDDASADFSLALTVSDTVQVGVDGDLDLQFALADPVDGVDLWDNLRLQAGYQANTFTFSVGIDAVTLNLLPFGGWSSLADIAAAGGVRLLNTALDALFTHLETDAQVVNFVTQARNLLTSLDLDTAAKIDALLNNPLAWLETRLSASNASATVTSLHGLLSIPLGGDITHTGGKLCFKNGDLQLCIGRDGANIGAWLDLDDLDLGPTQLGLAIGLETPSLSAAPGISLDLDFTTANALLDLGTVQLRPSVSVRLDPSPSIEIYPLGDIFTDHQFRLSLSPSVGFAADTGAILELVTDVLLPLSMELLIDSQPVMNFLSGDISTSVNVSLGEILKNAQLLTGTANNYNLAFPYTMEADKLIYGLLSAAMRAFDGMKFMGDKVEIVSKDRTGNIKHYGLKVTLPDITLLDDPELVLQLGDDKADWLERTGGPGGPDFDSGGVVFYLPTVDESDGNITLDDIDLLAEIELINFGVDISGKNDDPLLDAGGFRLGGVNIRTYLGITFDNPIDVRLGGSINVEQIGLPIGSAGGNVIARNLLSDDSGSGGENTSVNPAFSIELSYYKDLDVRLLGRNAGEAEIWFPIQKTFGPIHIGQVGVRWYDTDKAIELLLDGGVSLAGLNVYVDDLGVKVPIRTAQNLSTWKLGLRGLGVSYNEGGIKIAGALLRDDDAGTSYSGACLVEVSGKTFTAIGSYSKNQFTSMFVFVLLPIPIGGPPYLFITGLAGGFGYNRGLNVPPVETVPGFPLVEAARGSSAFTNDPLSALQQLGGSVPIKRGAYWVCGGIRFTSFELAKSVALAYVLLDRGVEVGLLGMSQMALPEGKPLVNLELALKARFSTIEGVFSVEARLSDNSWLLSRDCRLTGGFAFYVWFGGPHQGDFVITIGGYHPRFNKKSYYPDVPRLGFNWRVTAKVTIKGESYFALTASAVMAGGLLEASYKSGNLKAWFKAWANFLIAWKPFAYDIDMGISIGVSYRLRINLLFGTITKTFKLELGAEVWIWGPRFSGKAKVTWWVISFTVGFGVGDSKTDKAAISWEQFRDTFLPEDEKMFNADVIVGMIPQDKEKDDTDQVSPWLLQPEFRFGTETVLGTNQLKLFNKLYQYEDELLVDIRPMHRDDVLSTHIIDIRHKIPGTENFEDAIDRPDEKRKLVFRTNTEGFIRIEVKKAGIPAALWEHDGSSEKPDAKIIQSIIGVTLIAEVNENDESIDKTGEIPILDIFERGYHPLPFTREITERSDVLGFSENAELALADVNDSHAILVTASKVLGVPWFARRLSVLDTLEFHGANVAREETLRATAEVLGSQHVAPPKIASLYEGLAKEPNLRPVVADPPVVQVEIPKKPWRIPKLAALLRQRPELLKPDVGRQITSVENVANGRNLPRVNVRTRWSNNVLGAQLRRVAPPTRTTATRMVQTRAEFVADVHSSAGARKQFSKIESMAIRTHANAEDLAVRALRTPSSEKPVNRVQAGTTQLWDLPYKNARGEMPTVRFAGNQAIRITALNKSGALLQEREFFSGQGQWQMPALTARIAVTGLGKTTQVAEESVGLMGQVSLMESGNGLPVVGWQAHSQLVQVARLSFLGRGCMIRSGAVQLTRRRGKIVDFAIVKAAELLQAQSTLTTHLPKNVDLIAIHVELGASATVRELADGLGVSSKDFVLAEKPITIVNDNSALLVYTVQGFDKGEQAPLKAYGSMGTTTAEGWRITGVMGMRGRLDDWMRRLSKGLISPVVENGPLTAAGVSEVVFLVDDLAERNKS